METAALTAAVRAWIADDPDAATRHELEDLLAAEAYEELTDRFAGRLTFGTAGLRGVLGGGPNRMNRAVVLRTAAGLTAYLLQSVADVRERGVVIGFDARTLSRELAGDTAEVLCAAGIPALLFKGYAPTPLTAFAVTHLGASAGVMVTASHNPPEYNGYKVYWGNGAQIIPPHDRGIGESIDAVESVASVARLPLEEAKRAGLLRELDAEVEAAYLGAFERLPRSKVGRAISIVYTPLHGVGGPLALRTLRDNGFQVEPVREQLEPDARFPTVRFPNPEEKGAMDLALATARAQDATLVLANDPDADRLAVAVRTDGNAYRQLTGNEVGVLLASHLLDRTKGDDRLVITTIVSSPMLGAMARAHGVRYAEVLTGFKWIANRAMELEQKDAARFLFGYEEALGYSVGTVCRDKDGISAALVFAELAGALAAQGSSVLEALTALYRRYGLFLSHQHSLTLPGVEGQARLAELMAAMRASPPSMIGGSRVERRLDYLEQLAKTADGSTERLTLPASNVLAFELEGGSRITLRPSGTEPKLKFYFDLCEAMREGEPIEAARARGEARLAPLVQSFVAQVTALG